MRAPTPEEFLKDVRYHGMSIDLDSGKYRHLHFQRLDDDSWNQWFDIVTWPGSLTIRGDMGCWTFARVPDMFTFFRSKSELRINPHYWSEKIQNGVHGGDDSAREFDPDYFRERLRDYIQGFSEDPVLKSQIEGELAEALQRADGEHQLRAQISLTHPCSESDNGV